jgi:hypothetical protein
VLTAHATEAYLWPSGTGRCTDRVLSFVNFLVPIARSLVPTSIPILSK